MATLKESLSPVTALTLPAYILSLVQGAMARSLTFGVAGSGDFFTSSMPMLLNWRNTPSSALAAARNAVVRGKKGGIVGKRIEPEVKRRF